MDGRIIIFDCMDLIKEDNPRDYDVDKIIEKLKKLSIKYKCRYSLTGKELVLYSSFGGSSPPSGS